MIRVAMGIRLVLIGGGAMLVAACTSDGHGPTSEREGTAAAVASSPEGLRACLAETVRSGDGAKFSAYLEQGTPLRAAGAKVMASAVDVAGAKMALQEAVRAKYGSDALKELNPLFVFMNRDDGLKRMARQFESAEILRDEGHVYLVIQSKPAEVVEQAGMWKVIPAVPRDASAEDLETLARRNAALRDGLRAGKELVAKSRTVEELNDQIQDVVDKFVEASFPERGGHQGPSVPATLPAKDGG